MNASTIEQAIQETVKGALVTRKLTICALAKQSGVARSTLNHWLKGQRRIGLDTLCRVLATLQGNVIVIC
jgi:transcriptional regulator with XRE-family HTH domain